MMLKIVISCGDLNLHWDWSPSGLVELASKVVQERCLKNFHCCMHALPDPRLGLAISFAMARVLKASNHFGHFIFMYFSHLYLIQKNPEFYSVLFKWKRDQQQVLFS